MNQMVVPPAMKLPMTTAVIAPFDLAFFPSRLHFTVRYMPKTGKTDAMITTTQKKLC